MWSQCTSHGGTGGPSGPTPGGRYARSTVSTGQEKLLETIGDWFQSQRDKMEQVQRELKELQRSEDEKKKEGQAKDTEEISALRAENQKLKRQLKKKTPGGGGGGGGGDATNTETLRTFLIGALEKMTAKESSTDSSHDEHKTGNTVNSDKHKYSEAVIECLRRDSRPASKTLATLTEKDINDLKEASSDARYSIADALRIQSAQVHKSSKEAFDECEACTIHDDRRRLSTSVSLYFGLADESLKGLGMLRQFFFVTNPKIKVLLAGRVLDRGAALFTIMNHYVIDMDFERSKAADCEIKALIDSIHRREDTTMEHRTAECSTATLFWACVIFGGSDQENTYRVGAGAQIFTDEIWDMATVFIPKKDSDDADGDDLIPGSGTLPAYIPRHGSDEGQKIQRLRIYGGDCLEADQSKQLERLGATPLSPHVPHAYDRQRALKCKTDMLANGKFIRYDVFLFSFTKKKETQTR